MPRRRPTTRSYTKKFMVDPLKSSARSTAEIRSARIFKVSNFKMPESGFIEVSAEATKNEHMKKKSGKTKSRGTKKAEQTNPQRRVLKEKGKGHRDLVHKEKLKSRSTNKKLLTI